MCSWSCQYYSTQIARQTDRQTEKYSFMTQFLCGSSSCPESVEGDCNIPPCRNSQGMIMCLG